MASTPDTTDLTETAETRTPTPVPTTDTPPDLLSAAIGEMESIGSSLTAEPDGKD